MHSAILETDAAGNFVGSSYVHATALDYARYGLFYLQDGVWKGNRLLPEGWVRNTSTPAPANHLKNYGYQFLKRLQHGGIYKDDRADKHGYLNEACQTCQKTGSEHETTCNMSKQNIVAEDDQQEPAKGHPPCHHIFHQVHIARKFNAFEAKKNTKGDAQHIQPFWMVMITPYLKALHVIHTADFKVINKELP